MSGRGRSNHGDRGNNFGRSSGRGSGHFNNRRNNRNRNSNRGNNNNSNSHNSEMKFVPHYSGKQQMVTYDTVKDHIVQQIQKTFKYGNDMAQAIREMEYDDDNLGGGRPTRKVIDIPTEKDAREALHMTLQIEQEGYDIEYKEELRKYNIRKDVYEENKVKAYALIFRCCNKTMQNRIEESKDFESVIRDDPLELLKEIKKKMYDPARAKYEYVTLTESLNRILTTKQEDDENLVDYTKRFKQARDILCDTVGEDILHKFVETTNEYQKETDSDEQKKLKEDSFGKWTTYLYLVNSDQRKYGSLMKTFKTQYSLGQNQYCKSITKAGDVLTNHSWDTTFKEHIKKKKQQRQETKDKDKKDEEKSFAQTKGKKDPTCYCCGGNHYVSECDKKDKIPKDEWAVKKGLQMYSDENKNKDDNKEDNDKKDGSNNNSKEKKKAGFQGFQTNLMQQEEDKLDFNWSVILDTGSTFTSMKNKDLVVNVEQAEYPIQMRTNTGSREIERQGEVLGLDAKAWIDEDSVANIFSFSDLSDQFHVTFDNKKEDAFNVYVDDKIVKFKRSKEGLYYYNFPSVY